MGERERERTRVVDMQSAMGRSGWGHGCGAETEWDRIRREFLYVELGLCLSGRGDRASIEQRQTTRVVMCGAAPSP